MRKKLTMMEFFLLGGVELHVDRGGTEVSQGSFGWFSRRVRLRQTVCRVSHLAWGRRISTRLRHAPCWRMTDVGAVKRVRSNWAHRGRAESRCSTIGPAEGQNDCSCLARGRPLVTGEL